MAWTAPRTWVTNEIVTAAQLNTHVRDELLALGPSTIGTTISGIQTAVGAVDGMRARVRAGSTPYDFITLTYDATYAKWVSEPSSYVVKTATVNDTGFTTNTWKQFSTTSDAKLPLLPWRVLDTAGLRPQLRVTFQGGAGATGTFTDAFLRPAAYSGDTSGTMGYISVWTGSPSTVNNGADELRFGSWTNIDGGYTVKDLLGIGAFDGKVTGTGTLNINIAQITVSIRWVSA